MAKNTESSAAVDTLLRLLSLGVLTGTMLAAPNALTLLEKPLEKLFNELDEREKRRKLSQLKSYMKTRGYVKGEYEHGIQLTKKALDRLKDSTFRDLVIKAPEYWDGAWRLVLFDIPEEQRAARANFTAKLQTLNFQLLQQSVWIHPYPCRDEIMLLVGYFGIEKWVTYLETNHIENDQALKTRFSRLLP